MDAPRADTVAPSSGTMQGTVSLEQLRKDVQYYENRLKTGEQKIVILEEKFEAMKIEESLLSQKDKRLSRQIEQLQQKSAAQIKEINKIHSSSRRWEMNGDYLEAHIKRSTGEVQKNDKLLELREKLAEFERQKQILVERSDEFSKLIQSNNLEYKTIMEQLKNMDVQTLLTENE